MYEFVKDNKVGFGIDLLYEIEIILENITENEFNKLACNAQKIGFKLREGFYIKKAVQV